MAKEFSRSQRVAEQIQQTLAQLIQREIQDPKLGLVTVSAVRLSKDYKYAKVYVTVLGDNRQQIKDALLILNDSASYLRMLLAKTLNMRTTPALNFVFDETISYGTKLSALIDAAVASDEKSKK